MRKFKIDSKKLDYEFERKDLWGHKTFLIPYVFIPITIKDESEKEIVISTNTPYVYKKIINGGLYETNRVFSYNDLFESPISEEDKKISEQNYNVWMKNKEESKKFVAELDLADKNKKG